MWKGDKPYHKNVFTQKEVKHDRFNRSAFLRGCVRLPNKIPLEHPSWVKTV